MRQGEHKWKCYGGCGEYGDAVDFVRKVVLVAEKSEERDYKAAVKWLHQLG